MYVVELYLRQEIMTQQKHFADKPQMFSVNMNKILLMIMIFLLWAGQAMGADYVLPKGSSIFSNEFQIAHLENIEKDAIDGYLSNQLSSGRMIFTTIDVIVTIVDSCTFCNKSVIKIKTKDGKLSGWTFKESLKRIKKK